VVHAFQKKSKAGIGNVFADLGLGDAGEHLVKAGLVVRINRIIRQRRLTQAAAAQIIGIDQPKVSAMLAGQSRGYSVERLMRFLVALGHDVEIVVKPRKRGPRNSASPNPMPQAPLGKYFHNPPNPYLKLFSATCFNSSRLNPNTSAAI